MIGDNPNKTAVLWLPAWYPSELQPYSGDFIQRHARATSLYCRVNVLFVVRDKDGKVTRDIKIVVTEFGDLTETIIYYHISSLRNGLAEKLISQKKYLKLYKSEVRKYICKNGQPSLAHVHVADKNGLIALWMKRKWKIPFVISEHWSIYLKDAAPNFYNKSFLFRNIWNRTMGAADGLSVVSRYLGKAISAIKPSLEYQLIPNVVDRLIFNPSKNASGQVKKFIHISGLDPLKNIMDILRAFSIVKATSDNFILTIVGPDIDLVINTINELGLKDQVRMPGEMSQAKLAELIKENDALILYSLYETFGCVIIEANACGIPVIVSDIPVFHETVAEGINGFFVKPQNPQALAERIRSFINNEAVFPNKQVIADATYSLYSYAVIGKKIDEWYHSILSYLK